MLGDSRVLDPRNNDRNRGKSSCKFGMGALQLLSEASRAAKNDRSGQAALDGRQDSVAKRGLWMLHREEKTQGWLLVVCQSVSQSKDSEGCVVRDANFQEEGSALQGQTERRRALYENRRVPNDSRHG